MQKNDWQIKKVAYNLKSATKKLFFSKVLLGKKTIDFDKILLNFS